MNWTNALTAARNAGYHLFRDRFDYTLCPANAKGNGAERAEQRLEFAKSEWTLAKVVEYAQNHPVA